MSDERTLATVEPQTPNVVGMLQAVIDKGLTQENVTVIAQLIQLQERIEEKQAKRDFATAMVQLKLNMPPIRACKSVESKGQLLYKYAPLEEIDSVLRPAALSHGFSYSFSEAPGDLGRVTKLCIVTHIGGHSESTPFTVRGGKGPPNCSEAQSDGASATYAQRRALCDAFGIIVESDTDGSDDARNEGRPITAKEAADLRDWVEAVGADEKAFLEFAGAATFETIGSSRLDDLQGKLRRKEKANLQGK